MTHKQRVLQLLSDHKPHSHHELYGLGCVAHSRISDLRKDGHLIRQWRDGDLYLYALESAPAPRSLTPPPVTGTSAAGADSSALSNPSSPHVHDVAAEHTNGRDGDALTLFEVTA